MRYNIDLDTDWISLEWLTDMLRSGGFLQAGEVIQADLEADIDNPSTLSRFYSLELKYSSQSKGHLPTKMILKSNCNEFFSLGKREAAFYELARETKNMPSIATCYGSEVSDEALRAILFLEDLSQTHESIAKSWPSPPNEEGCQDAISRLASIHASYWKDPRLVQHQESIRTWSLDWILRAQSSFPAFADDCRDVMFPELKKVYEAIFDRFAGLIELHFHADKPQTLLHGDAHFWNFLYQNGSSSKPTTLIDWQLWKVGPPAFDLAYMLALQLEPDPRQRVEESLLKHYCEEMNRMGVGLRWEQFYLDYRIAVIFNFLYPVLMHAKGLPRRIWQPQLKRSFSAFHQIGASELLRET